MHVLRHSRENSPTPRPTRKLWSFADFKLDDVGPGLLRLLCARRTTSASASRLVDEMRPNPAAEKGSRESDAEQGRNVLPIVGHEIVERNSFRSWLLNAVSRGTE
jgi:hypothetical protein